MCSELFRIPLDWLNASVFGNISVGMLLALSVGIGILKALAWGRRTGQSSEVWGYVPGLAIIAVSLLLVPRFVAAIPVRGYGVMVLLGSVLGIMMAVHRARQIGLSPDVIFSLAFGLFICGIIGARLFFVIEYWDTRFQFGDWRKTLVEALKFTEGGLVVYGSLIGATLAFLVFTLRRGLSPLAMADLIAPSLLAGLALGRIGCLLNGCCYGGESDQPWAVTFPRDSMPYMEQVAAGRMFGFSLAESPNKDSRPVVTVVDSRIASNTNLSVGTVIDQINGRSVANLEQAHQTLFEAFSAGSSLTLVDDNGKQFAIPAAIVPARSRPVHPTQIYSAVNAALLSWVLWSFYPLRRRDGEVTALMLTVYPVARFLLEIIRIDEAAVFGTGLSISQNISIIIFCSAIGLWMYLRRLPPFRAKLALAN
ncbi:MAG: prolipoprotein diacylglyceryl transferase [Planctomycetota bacterium]